MNFKNLFKRNKRTEQTKYMNTQKVFTTSVEGCTYTVADNGTWICKNPKGLSFNFRTSNSNCKLGYIDSFNLFMGSTTDKNSFNENKPFFDAFLKIMRIANYIHITNESLFEWLKENYEYYYAEEIGLGYNGKKQYHILIRSESMAGTSYKAPNWKKIAEEEKKASERILTIINSNASFKRSKLAKELKKAFEIK